MTKKTVTIYDKNNQALTSFEFEEMPEDKETGYEVLDEVIEWISSNGYTYEDYEDGMYHTLS